MPRNRRYPSTSETRSITVPLDSSHYLYRWSTRSERSGTVAFHRAENQVTVSHNTNDKRYEQTVWLSFTPTNFDGKRAWFVCPQCYRRVGRLFWPVHGGWAFRCRHCWRLRYYTQRLTPEWRAR